MPKVETKNITARVDAPKTKTRLVPFHPDKPAETISGKSGGSAPQVEKAKLGPIVITSFGDTPPISDPGHTNYVTPCSPCTAVCPTHGCASKSCR
jgi:hypothetical protein